MSFSAADCASTARCAGNIVAEEGKPGTLVVSEQARVEGEIRVPHIVINGTVVGPVHSTEYVELQAKANVTGDVYYNTLEMQLGAVVEGRLVHQDAAKSDKIVQLKPAIGRLSRLPPLTSRHSQEHAMNAVTEQMPEPLVFTDSAANKVKQLIEEEGNPDLKLRVFVTGGGCSGFQYGFTFDEATNDDDTTHAESRRDAADRPDEPAVPHGRGDRLPGKRRRRAVRDQESERDFDLRLRIVLLGLSAERQPQAVGRSRQ